MTVDQVSLIVGPPVANIANAIKETSEGYDVPVVGLAMDPACQTKSEGVPYKNMFALQPSATTQGDIMAAFAVKNGYKTFGILYNQENAYSVSLLAPFVDRLAEENITVDNSMIVAYGAADTDYKTLLLPLVNANVDAIYCPNYTQQLVAIETAATELGYKGKIITGLDARPASTPPTAATAPTFTTSTTSIPRTKPSPPRSPRFRTTSAPPTSTSWATTS